MSVNGIIVPSNRSSEAANKTYVDDKVYNYINYNLINTIKLWTYPTNYNQEIALTDDYGVTADVKNNFKKAAFINVKLPARTGPNYASLAVQYNNYGEATSAVGQAKIFAYNQKAYADVIIDIDFNRWVMAISPDWHHMFTNPEKDYDAANKVYVDTKATKYSYTHTIPVSAWQKQTDGSYKCTRTISGIAETDTPYINLEYQTTTTADQTNEKTEYSKIGRAVTATNSITFTCFSSAPTIALTLNIQGTRGANSTGGPGALAIADGGTGAFTAIDARTNLGAAPAYSYGETDLIAGTSPLAAGTLYFVYE